MFRLFASLLSLLLVAGASSAQCARGKCSLLSARSKTTVRTRTTTVQSAPVAVVAVAPVVAAPAAPPVALAPTVASGCPCSQVVETVIVRQRARR